jgi:hypothetical protein
MANTTQPSATDADEVMRLAIERFRTKMESSNRQFLQDRIDEIEAMNLSTEEEKLRQMRIYWSDVGIKRETHSNDGAPPGAVRQSREEINCTRLADVRSLYHQYMDGIDPPRWPLTDEWRQMYLETVQSLCNEVAVRDEEDEDLQIPLCHDLGSFMKYADGVQDPDFHCSGIAPFDPVFGTWIGNHAFEDNPTARPVLDISEIREALKDHLRQFMYRELQILSDVDEDLEVKVGFITGTGCLNDHDKWYSAYLYCRRYVDDPDPSRKDWAWRVVFFGADLESPTTLYGREPIFDSISEFLEWYSSWPEYLDIYQVRRNAIGFEFDDDNPVSDYAPAVYYTEESIKRFLDGRGALRFLDD